MSKDKRTVKFQWKKLVVAIAIIVVLLMLATIFLPQLHNSSQPIGSKDETRNPSTAKPAIEAVITAFNVDWGGLPPVVGVTMCISFNITVKNTGTEDLDELLIMVRKEPDDNDSRFFDNIGSSGRFALYSGQTSKIGVDLFTDLNKWMYLISVHQNFLATLSLNGTVLDEHMLYSERLPKKPLL